MAKMATMIGGLVITVVAAMVPAPQQILKTPKVLYGAAMIKAVSGDADSALRLLQESTAPAPEKPTMKTAQTCPLTKRG